MQRRTLLKLAALSTIGVPRAQGRGHAQLNALDPQLGVYHHG